MFADSGNGLTLEQRQQIKAKTKGVVKEGARRTKQYRLAGTAASRIKANPYLLPIVAALAPELTTGEDGFQAAAQYLITARFIAGIETSAGKLFDEQFMKILGGQVVPGKQQYLDLKRSSNGLNRRKTSMDQVAFEAERARLNSEIAPLGWLAEFDSYLNRDDVRYYLSIKLGPWTINDTMAREMATAFGTAVANGIIPVLGIIYGTEEDLSNKPRIVMEGSGGVGLLKVGGDFLNFVTGSDRAASQVFDSISEGCQEARAEEGTVPPFAAAIEAVAEELRNRSQIGGQADIYAVARALAVGVSVPGDDA